jgi:hypothetical protein
MGGWVEGDNPFGGGTYGAIGWILQNLPSPPQLA